MCNYYGDEPSDPLSSNSESFKCKRSVSGNTYNIGYRKNKAGRNKTEVVISLKHLSNFWRNLNIPIINCEVELILTWSENCVLVDMKERDAEGDNPAIFASTGLEFKITDTKLYVPVVKENDTKLLKQLKSGFKKNYKMEQIQITNGYSK